MQGSKNLAWRALIGLFAILMAFIYLTPTLTEEIPGWWANILPRDKIVLGIDLQGGMHLVLEVKNEKAVENTLERIRNEMRDAFRDEKIRHKGIDYSGI